jgi:electron transfer flavoprotein alpha subunit
MEEVNKYAGFKNVYTAEHDAIDNSYGGSVAEIVAKLVKDHSYTQVVAASSGFGKDIIPRVGGILDLQPITDVVEIIEEG